MVWNILTIVAIVLYVISLAILLNVISGLRQRLKDKDNRITKLEYSLDEMYDKVESLKEHSGNGNLQSNNQ